MGFVMQCEHSDDSEIKLIKKYIQESYTTFGTVYPDTGGITVPLL